MNKTRSSMFYNSPAGCMYIKVSGGFINEILFIKEEKGDTKPPADVLSVEDNRIFERCVIQLDEYFAGTRKVFDLPTRQYGTEFQQRVWKELMEIPYGKTVSYLQVAKKLGDIKVIRAAASANGRNQLSIIVPCHRVIGSDGSLTGYGGGLHRKKWLLDHENKCANGVNLLFS